MRRLYSLLIICAAPIAFAAVLWRGLRDRSYWLGLKERFGWGESSTLRTIWLHAVSLGEMSAAAPLMRGIRSRHPRIPLIVTTATPAGRERALALFGDGVDVRYVPYDTPGSVKRFLTRIQPRVAIIMETELWPNLFLGCDRLGVPVILANARLSPRSVASYQRFGALFSGVFTGNVLVAAQSADDAQRFRAIGASAADTRIVGNVKFDLQPDPAAAVQGHGLRAALGLARSVWIAGSTHAGEEEQVLDAQLLLQARRPDALLLLVPRHKDRFQDVADMLARRGIKFARRSAAVTPAHDVQVLLVDTVGELAVLYASADIAFVGGSLVPVGGHNLLEPASLGLPVLTGPFNFNGKDIAELLLMRGAAFQVANAQDLAAALARLFDAPAERRRIGIIGQDIVEANRGSVARLLDLIEPRLGEMPLAVPQPVAPPPAGHP